MYKPVRQQDTRKAETKKITAAMRTEALDANGGLLKLDQRSLHPSPWTGKQNRRCRLLSPCNAPAVCGAHKTTHLLTKSSLLVQPSSLCDECTASWQAHTHKKACLREVCPSNYSFLGLDQRTGVLRHKEVKLSLPGTLGSCRQSHASYPSIVAKAHMPKLS